MSIYRTKPVQDTFALGMIDATTSLRLTSELVTQTIGIVAKKRTGKSYLAKRLTEGLMDMGQQVCVVDPKGDWWGLRSSADGKGEGYPIVIFGGEHGDVPLEAGGGEVVATFVVESGTCTLLDLSLLRKHEVATFMTAFLETLYRLKAREVNRTPMMLVVDEADAIAPQKPQPNEARMLGAMQDIVRRGGQRGVGCTMVTQRTAVLSKDVLTQVQILIALRTISPQDLKAMNEWIDVHGTTEQRKTLMASLPSLPIGEAWVWSPGWPTEEGIFDRIRTVKITTYDSGATPKPGEKRVEPKVVSAVDLDKLRGHMAATIEQAKANDPKALKAKIMELSGQVRVLEVRCQQQPGHQGMNIQQHERLLKDAVAKAIAGRDAQWRSKWDEQHRNIRAAFGGYPDFGEQNPPQLVSPKIAQQVASKWKARWRTTDESALTEETAKGTNGDIDMSQGTAVVGGKVVDLKTGVPRGIYQGISDSRGEGAVTMSAPLRKILTVLAQHNEQHPSQAMPNERCAIRAGYSYSGGFRNYLSELRGQGWIANGSGGICITAPGLTALGSYESLPTGPELLEWWKQRVSNPEAKILTTLTHHPCEFSGADLAKHTGYEYSGGFRNYLSALRTKGLIVGSGKDLIRLHEDLT